MSLFKKSLKEKIAAFDRHYRGMTNDLAGSEGWEADSRALDQVGGAILAHKCRTMGEYRRWLRYVRSVPDLTTAVTDAMVLAGRAEVIKAYKSRRKPVTTRTRDDPQTTYEIGIIGSDRVPLGPPGTGWGPYHKKYPLDLMEVGETFLVPGLVRRAQMGGTLDTAEREHKRRFASQKVDGGLLVKRVE